MHWLDRLSHRNPLSLSISQNGQSGWVPQLQGRCTPQTFLRDSFILKKQSSFNLTCSFCGCFIESLKKSILGLRRRLNQESDSCTDTGPKFNPSSVSTIAYALTLVLERPRWGSWSSLGRQSISIGKF